MRIVLPTNLFNIIFNDCNERYYLLKCILGKTERDVREIYELVGEKFWDFENEPITLTSATLSLGENKNNI